MRANEMRGERAGSSLLRPMNVFVRVYSGTAYSWGGRGGSHFATTTAVG